jgi:hypothetical protein
MDLGLQVVRWSASDISRGLPALVKRLADRLDAGDRATFTGRVVPPAPLPWADSRPT